MACHAAGSKATRAHEGRLHAQLCVIHQLLSSSLGIVCVHTDTFAINFLEIFPTSFTSL